MVKAATVYQAVRSAQEQTTTSPQDLDSWLGVRPVGDAPSILMNMAGSSMLPALANDDVVQFDTTATAPARGAIAAFHPLPRAGGNRMLFIKRVVGLPHETIAVEENRVLVNGRKFDEPYVATPTRCPFPSEFCNVVLGADEYYVMGDNRINSVDSRFWGPVKTRTIVGTATAVERLGVDARLRRL